MTFKLTPEQIQRINDRDSEGLSSTGDCLGDQIQLFLDRRALLNHIQETSGNDVPDVTVRNGVVSAKRLTPFDRTKANWKTR